MKFQREFFDRVPKTVMPRPYFAEENDILGQSGTAWAVDAAIYGDNCYCGLATRALRDRKQGLIEVYEDEFQERDIFLIRSFDEIEKLYSPQEIAPKSVKNFLMEKIHQDDEFAKRCLAILGQDRLMNKDLSQLFIESGLNN